MRARVILCGVGWNLRCPFLGRRGRREEREGGREWKEGEGKGNGREGKWKGREEANLPDEGKSDTLWSGVESSLSFVFTSAPFSIKSFIHSMFPLKEAFCNGVLPVKREM
jgi:hypothetical protein